MSAAGDDPDPVVPLDLSGPGRVLGASYVAAVLAGDTAMVAMYRESFQLAELMNSVDQYVLIMGRRIATDSGRTLAEVGDAFVRAAIVQQANSL